MSTRYPAPPEVVNKVIDGVITMPTGGKWIRCDDIHVSGQIENGRPIWWKCHRKKDHDGDHKDNRMRNRIWPRKLAPVGQVDSD